MSLISDEIVDALLEMEADMGEGGTPKTVTVAGASYPCVPTKGTNGNILGVGGFEPNKEYAFYIRKSLVATLPKSGQDATFDGKSLKISPDGVTVSACGAYVIINCVDRTKGA